MVVVLLLTLALLLLALALTSHASPGGMRQWQSVAISGNQWQSVAISGNHWQGLTWRHAEAEDALIPRYVVRVHVACHDAVE